MLMLYILVRFILGIYFSDAICSCARIIQGHYKVRYINVLYFILSFGCTSLLWFMFVDIGDPYKVGLLSFCLCVYPIVKLTIVTEKVQLSRFLMYGITSAIADIYLVCTYTPISS